MAIKGLTDRGLSFPQIGNIRKGDNGGKNGAPRDLQYFRVELDEREAAASAAFLSAYGPQPTEINIVLPFDDIDRCWDAWCEAYTAGRMVARSDGEYFIYLVDLKSGAVIVRDGVDERGIRVPHREVIGRTEKSVIKCRPVGRLKVIVPELKRFAYLVVHTTSVIDVRNISEQLEAIKAVNGGHIVGVPLVLRRRPREISVPNPDGTRRRPVKWMLSIEADPRWVKAQLVHLDNLALPDGARRLSLPNVPETTPEAEEGEWQDMAEEGDEDPEPIPPAPVRVPDWDQVWPVDAKVSLDLARTIRNSEEIPYLDISHTDMVTILANLTSTIAKNGLTAERRTDLLLKRDLAQIIVSIYESL